MLSSTVSSSCFSSMLTIAWTTACTVVSMIIFSSIHVHVNRNVTMALNKVNCSLWVKVAFRLSAQSFDFWTFCKMTSLIVSFIIGGFRLGRLFQVAKIEYDLISIFVLPKFLGLCNVKLFLHFTVSPTLSGSA